MRLLRLNRRKAQRVSAIRASFSTYSGGKAAASAADMARIAHFGVVQPGKGSALSAVTLLKLNDSGPYHAPNPYCPQTLAAFPGKSIWPVLRCSAEYGKPSARCKQQYPEYPIEI
jgi:hypothetical protein